MIKDISPILPNECLHWIYESNRYLFLAKVYLNNFDTCPTTSGDLISYVEKMLNACGSSRTERPYRRKLLFKDSDDDQISSRSSDLFYLKLNVSKFQLLYLRDIFIKIRDNEWDAISKEDISKSQKILYKILKPIKIQIEV